MRRSRESLVTITSTGVLEVSASRRLSSAMETKTAAMEPMRLIVPGAVVRSGLSIARLVTTASVTIGFATEKRIVATERTKRIAISSGRK